MAVRKILTYGDAILRTKTKEVHKISKKVQEIVTDLLETMYVTNNGVGLAAPQIGESYRIFVIDVSSNDEPLNPLVFINPKIIKKSGVTVSHEGCLSFPDAYTDVRRYANVMVKALNRKGQPFALEAKDGSLLARAIQHEFDHLDGILFIDHSINRFETDAVLQEAKLPPLEVDRLLEEPELQAELESALENIDETTEEE